MLTDMQVKKAKSPARGQIDISDGGGVPGFALRVTHQGRKSFVLRYRVQAGRAIGKQRRYTLGRYPMLSLAEARAMAIEALATVATGGDPAAEKKEARERDFASAAVPLNTYQTVVEEFIEKYAKVRQRTWPETRRVLLRNCHAWLNRPIDEITETDAYQLLDGFIADGHGHKARVTLAWLRKLWRWAKKRKIVPAAVMDDVEIEFERTTRTRYYTDDEIHALWEGAQTLPRIQRDYLKLLLLLGVRKNELAKMRRSELDDPDNPTVWTIPTERTKTRKSARQRVYVVPLPPLAQRILKGLLRGKGEMADLVFPGRRAGKAMDPGSPLTRRIREASGIDDFYFHACRDTVATWLQNRGANDYELKLVLNHADTTGATRNYSHGFAVNPKRQLLERWAGHIEGLISPAASVKHLT